MNFYLSFVRLVNFLSVYYKDYNDHESISTIMTVSDLWCNITWVKIDPCSTERGLNRKKVGRKENRMIRGREHLLTLTRQFFSNWPKQTLRYICRNNEPRIVHYTREAYGAVIKVTTYRTTQSCVVLQLMVVYQHRTTVQYGVVQAAEKTCKHYNYRSKRLTKRSCIICRAINRYIYEPHYCQSKSAMGMIPK